MIEITEADVDDGVPAALRRMGSLVHEPALADLSHVDRSFLLAMALDEDVSKTGDVAGRLGVDSKYASVYRQRLIEAQMISSAGRGLIRFTLPYMRDYLREHHAAHTTVQLDSNVDEHGPAPNG